MNRNFFRLFTIAALVAILFHGTIWAAGEIQIIVSVPNSTPDNEKICITGNTNQLSNWDGAGIPLEEIGPNLYSYSGSFPIGQNIEFKFTRGSFASVEKTSQGLEIQNRQLKIYENNKVHKAFVEAWADQLGDQNSNNKPNITGNYKILKNIPSKYLKPIRTVVVWLPETYNHTEAQKYRYPVIYMHDGGNLFDPGTSFGGMDWGVDEAMHEGTKAGYLKDAIVVGVYNTVDRMSEYTPFPDPKHKGGNGENYAKFMVKELKPLIDSKFRTLPDRENTFIGGSSLGGLISLYIGISRPKVFSGIIAMSPSIWWANGGIINWLLENKVSEFDGKIWVDMGTREGEEAIEFSRKLSQTIKSECPAYTGLIYKEFTGGTHSEGSWRQRIHLPLKLFIGK